MSDATIKFHAKQFFPHLGPKYGCLCVIEKLKARGVEFSQERTDRICGNTFSA